MERLAGTNRDAIDPYQYPLCQIVLLVEHGVVYSVIGWLLRRHRMEAGAMRGSHLIEAMPIEDVASERVVRTNFCPRDGRRISVIFAMSGGAVPARAGVALCPLNTYSDLFDPPLGGSPCDLACLSAIGG